MTTTKREATATPQRGIFREDADHHVFLEFALRRPLLSLPGGALARAPLTAGEQVIAFGEPLLRGLATPTPPVPAFRPIDGGAGRKAPATQQAVFVWLHGALRDELFARAMDWRGALAPVATLSFENHGFRFRDSRDLNGFVDGTANPKGEERQRAALIGAGRHAGGSFVLAQRWEHDLAKFNALPVADQERVFGRTKPDSVELVGDAMPADSHVSRTDLPGIAIYRRSAPVGGVANPGLFFLAFSADAARFDRLLRSMFGLAEDGFCDRMLAYTRPATGSYYYAPPAGRLADAFSA